MKEFVSHALTLAEQHLLAAVMGDARHSRNTGNQVPIFPAGGCVRDWSRGKRPRDVDLWVPYPFVERSRELIESLDGAHETKAYEDTYEDERITSVYYYRIPDKERPEGYLSVDVIEYATETGLEVSMLSAAHVVLQFDFDVNAAALVPVPELETYVLVAHPGFTNGVSVGVASTLRESDPDRRLRMLARGFHVQRNKESYAKLPNPPKGGPAQG